MSMCAKNNNGRAEHCIGDYPRCDADLSFCGLASNLAFILLRTYHNQTCALFQSASSVFIFITVTGTIGYTSASASASTAFP